MTVADPNLSAALSVIDQTWNEVRKDPLIALSIGEQPSHLPDLGYEEAERMAAVGEALLQRIKAIDVAALPGDLGLTVEIARLHGESWARRARWYWLIIDVAFPVCFLPTVYGGGYMLNTLKAVFARHPFQSIADRHRYLALVDEYARLVSQMAARTRGQADRGIL